MKSRLVLSLLAMSGLAMVPSLSFAGGKAPQDKSKSVRTLTGCLSRGDKAGEYDLRAEDGSTWELNTKAVRLSKHVGHTVTVTGKVWHADMHGAKEKMKDEVKPDANEHGHLSVTAVHMDSESCK